MFHKLHRQMTLFCTAVTGAILISLTIVCLFVAENGLKKNSYTSFLKESSSVLSHLQEQDTVSLPYLNGLREKNGFEFVLYDNGAPLFSQYLSAPGEALGEPLIHLATETAEEEYRLSLFSDDHSRLSSHTEFSLSPDGRESYYVCAGKISKNSGLLSFLIFYSLKQQQRQIFMQRFLFALADVSGLILLFLFSRFFTKRMLLPLEENHRKQNRFVSSASHELRTPLAVILSGLEALEKSENREEQRHFAGMMRREGRRMQHLISDMLLLANSDADALRLHSHPCQPDELLLCAYEKYELLAKEKQIALKLTLPDTPLPDVCCDGERILQVISILLDNALSYTPAGGTVTLSANSLTASGASIPLPKTARLLLCVSDTGCGVPDRDKKQIFERFYRGESSRTDKEHFGLGLCIAREIVEAHHGKLFVTDAPGGGACFCVALK